MNQGDQIRTSLADREAAVFELAVAGGKERALAELLALVVEAARTKDFPTAERLRERFYEIDPMALTEIILAGEIIEEEKTASIDQDQFKTWSELLAVLTREEFNTVFHEMERRNYAPEEEVASRGAITDELYFINQGSLKVSYLKEQKEIFITDLNQGEIAGESFFTPSVWTLNLTALTPTNISVLPRKKLDCWQGQHPGLETKLRDYYYKFNNINQLLQKKGLERREGHRYPLSRKALVQMVDRAGKAAGQGVRADVSDISLGGLAFVIRIAQREKVRMLLGRSLRLTIPSGGNAGRCFEGMVLAVQPLQFMDNEFVIHLKFNDHLDQETLQAILG